MLKCRKVCFGTMYTATKWNPGLFYQTNISHIDFLEFHRIFLNLVSIFRLIKPRPLLSPINRNPVTLSAHNQHQSTLSRQTGRLFLHMHPVNLGVLLSELCVCVDRRSAQPALRKNILLSRRVAPRVAPQASACAILSPVNAHLPYSHLYHSDATLWPLGLHSMAGHFHCVIITASCLWPSDISSCFLSD